MERSGRRRRRKRRAEMDEIELRHRAAMTKELGGNLPELKCYIFLCCSRV